MSVDLNRQSTSPSEPSPLSTLLDRVWTFLLRPWLLLALAGLALILVVTAAVLPQLPGQFVTDPVSASRWFLTTANDYGSVGGTLRDLGLFDLTHSLTLRFLLAGLGLLLLLHTGELVGRAWAMHRLSAAVAEAGATAGEPVALNMGSMVQRQRVAVDRLPVDLTEAVGEQMATQFPAVQTTTHLLEGDGNREGGVESRLLGVEHGWAAWLRAAGGVGLMLGLAAMWLAVNLGWAVDLPLLTPGATFRYAPHVFSLAYTVPNRRPPAQLQIGVGEAQTTLSPVGPNRTARLGTVSVSAESVSPGLFIVTNRAALAPAGQGQLLDQVGLLFPSPGAEETVTLPEQESALRLVRLPGPPGGPDGSPTFLVELFDSRSAVSGEPAQRLEIQSSEASSLFLDGGQLQVTFVPMPGLAVSVASLPGLWLLWPALILILVGGVGFLRRPRFVLAQIAPWPTERSVIIVQSDDPAGIEQLQISSEIERLSD